jgi:hypothetical protein
MQPSEGALHTMAPGWELASVLTEIMAFFLVTIDLYGEERLAVLHRRIASVFSSVVAHFRKTADPDLSPTFFVIAAPFLFLFCYGFKLLLDRGNPFDPGTFGYVIMYICSAVMWVFVWVGLVISPLMVVLLIVQGLSHVGLWLLRTVELRGILLTLGALLFVFSKSILVLKALRELDFSFTLPFF